MSDVSDFNLGALPVATIVVTICFLAVTWSAVTLRVFARATLTHSFGLDDWLLIATLIVNTVDGAVWLKLATVELRGNLGAPATIELLAGYIIGFQALYILTTIVLKLSLAAFFLRIVVENWQRRTIYIAVAVYTILGTVFLLLSIFHCGNPVHVFRNYAAGKCIRFSIYAAFAYIQGSLNAITDWLFAFLVFFVVQKSMMPMRAKVSVYSVLAIGVLASTASCVRLAYVLGLALNPAFLKHSIQIAIWSIIEPGLGIIAASLMTLRPIFQCCLERRRGSGQLPSARHPEDPPMASQQTMRQCDATQLQLDLLPSWALSRTQDMDDATTSTLVDDPRLPHTSDRQTDAPKAQSASSSASVLTPAMLEETWSDYGQQVGRKRCSWDHS